MEQLHETTVYVQIYFYFICSFTGQSMLMNIQQMCNKMNQLLQDVMEKCQI